MEWIKGTWALRKGPRRPPSAIGDLGSEADPDTVGLSGHAGRALLDCGWRLIEPSGEVAKDLEAGRRPPEAPEALRIYGDPHGLLVLATGRVTVLFDAGSSPREAVDRARAAGHEVVERYLWHPCALSLAVPRGQEPVAHADRIQARLGADIVSCRPEFLCYLPPSQTVSGYASEYKEQWQWNNTGQSQGTGRAGKPGADIRVEKAWTLTKGKGMCIAVVDCGFRWKHNDLLRAVLSHSATVHSGPESVSVSIGCVAMPSDEKNPHGTPCASNAAAPGAAAGRICGAAPEASLLLVAIESWASGPGIAKALHYAAFPACYQFPAVPPSRIRGADVISFSRKLGGLEPGSADCVKTALGDLSKGRDGLGIPFFYAAPHRKLDGDQSGFPVDFATEHDVVLTIGATDRSDMALRQGPKPEFVAPGESVFMADPRGEDMADYNSGTSFAAPVAAGVAALVLSKRPCLSVSELRRLMRASCDKVGSGVYGTDGYDTTERYGFGRINAARAVGAVRPPPDWLSWTLPPH